MTQSVKALLGIIGVLVVSTASVSAGDPVAGERVFKKCLVCHEIGAGAKNKVGPLLNGIVGRQAGTIEGFAYTAQNKNSGIVWGESVFREYIKDPRAKIPGTKMVGINIRNEKEAEDLWEYIKLFDASGKKR